MGKVIIYHKRSSQILFLLGSLVFIVSGIWIIFGNFNLLHKIAGIVAILFFGYGAVFFVKGMISPTPLLIIDENGITDNSTASSVGYIPWEDVVNISKVVTAVVGVKMASGRYIAVDVKDINKYTDKASPLAAKMMSANMSLGYHPINIALYLADRKLEDVFEILNKYFDEYKKNK